MLKIEQYCHYNQNSVLAAELTFCHFLLEITSTGSSYKKGSADAA